MKKTVLRFGLYGATTICVLMLLSWFLGKELDFTTQEIIGYASMIVSLSFVYFGIKHFRDVHNSGNITLGGAILIGVLISILTALAFGILDVIYIKYINPDFVNEYYDANLTQMKETLSEDEFQTKQAEMESQKELFSSTWVSFLLMSITVFVIGFIISLISALILQRKN